MGNFWEQFILAISVNYWTKYAVKKKKRKKKRKKEEEKEKRNKKYFASQAE